jgi:hypothetical protein
MGIDAFMLGIVFYAALYQAGAWFKAHLDRKLAAAKRDYAIELVAAGFSSDEAERILLDRT